MKSDALDDGSCQLPHAAFTQGTARTNDISEADENARTFGVLGTKPQTGIIFIGHDGQPFRVPYSWLEKACEDEHGRLVIVYANDVKVTLEGRMPGRSIRKSILTRFVCSEWHMCRPCR